MKKTLLILAFASLGACSKKSDNPKPQEATVQKSQQAEQIPEPYYPRLGRPKAFDDCSILIAGITYLERYVGHDDAHVPKADVYVFQQYIQTPQNTSVLTMDSKLRIWWINDVPHSDSLVFKKESTGWMQTRWQYEKMKVSPATIWEAYSYTR